MSEPMDVEKDMREISSAPEPDAEFMNSLRSHFIAEGYAIAKQRQETPMKTNLFFKRPLWAQAALGVLVLIVLLTAPAMVSALRRLFGYVPNVGVIDQTVQVRMLAEPVTVVRENVSVTVEQVVANALETVVIYSYDLPAEVVYPAEVVMDTRTPRLTSPDGTQFDFLLGQQVAHFDCAACDLRYSMRFAPLPADVDVVVLDVPGLTGLPVDAAPLDWQFQLQLKIASPEDIMPVIEQTMEPTPLETETGAATQPEIPYGIVHVLDKFVPLDDGYLLYGFTTWTDPIVPAYGLSPVLATITDANGNDVPFEFVDPGVYPNANELRQYWAYKLTTTQIQAPLTLNFVLTASIPADGGSFTFEPGANPQTGQRWDINQEVIVNGSPVRVLYGEYAGFDSGNFLFAMQSDTNIVGATITDLNHPPMGGGGGGGGLPQVGVPFFTNFGYALPIPQGPLTLTFTDVTEIVPGDWTLEWSP